MQEPNEAEKLAEGLNEQQKSAVFDGGLLYKSVMVEDKAEKRDIISKWFWLKSYGNYNTMPQPYKEITEDEYIHKTMSYSPKYSEYRQVRGLLPDRMMSCHIHWYSGFGIAIVHPNRWGMKDGKIHWEERTLYYLIGCDHKMVELSQKQCRERGITHFGMCWHVYECAHCGYTKAEDSSD